MSHSRPSLVLRVATLISQPWSGGVSGSSVSSGGPALAAARKLDKITAMHALVIERFEVATSLVKWKHTKAI